MSLLTPIIRQQQADLNDGEYVGILFRIVEKGTQHGVFKQTNQEYKRPKVLLTWVLPEQMQAVRGELRPALIHKEYTHSMRQSAHLYRDVVAMRGFDFTDADQHVPFDLLSMLGAPCLLSVKISRNGDYSHIDLQAIKPLPVDTLVPDCPYMLYSLTFSEWNWEYYDELSPALRQDIAKSPEFQRLEKRADDLTSVKKSPTGTVDESALLPV